MCGASVMTARSCLCLLLRRNLNARAFTIGRSMCGASVMTVRSCLCLLLRHFLVRRNMNAWA
jgi:hypothetical protein